MKLKSKKSPGLVWLVALVVVIVITGVGYFVFQSNTNSKHSAINQQTNINQPDKKSEVKTGDASRGTVITTGSSKFGPILLDQRRQAIYIWEVEKSTTAECYGDCAKEWPPVLTDGAPSAAGSISHELLGTTKRTDGTIQVTYNGHPLYYYAHENPGEVKCHNVSSYGGLWWVIQPSGVRV